MAGESGFSQCRTGQPQRRTLRTQRRAGQQPGARIDLAVVAERLEALGEVRHNPYLVRAHIDDYEITLFPDGRAIIKGMDDPDLARSLYARYVGVEVAPTPRPLTSAL